MKVSLLFGLGCLFSVLAYSQSDGLLINENFPYSNGNLSGQGSSPAWTSTGSGGDVVVTSLTNNTGALVYPGYTSGQSYVTTSGSNTRDPYKGFIGSQAVSTANATTFYMSFVVRVGSSANTSLTILASPTVALRTSAGGDLGYFHIADDGASTPHLKFGISKVGLAATYAAGNFSFNTTYLIVIRYDIVPGGTSNDKMYMWVDPLLTTEPSTASANASITSGSDGSISGSVNALQLMQDNFFGIDGTTAQLDAFKVAYATGYTGSPSNSNIAWADLSPVGAPLPVKLGQLKATQETSGIRLDWNSYSEENVSHYEIERSANGASFTQIGQLQAAGNSSSETDYTWLDDAPLANENFYRLKSVDIDGHAMYSTIVKISLVSSSMRSMAIYPNPLKGRQLTLQLNNVSRGNYSVTIFSRTGQMVTQFQVTVAGANTTQTLALPSQLQAGTYNLVVTDGSLRISKSFVVQ